jgi:hypothetical protein
MTKISNQYSLTNVLFADTTNGRVGVNNGSPSYLIDAYSTGASNARINIAGTTNFVVSQYTNTGGAMYVGIDDSAGANFTGTAYGRFIYSSGAYPMSFIVNAVERMRITSAGNIGIGTSSPGAKLTVVGASANTYLALDNVGSGENYYAANNFHVFQTAGSERMRITSDGSIGINGAPNPDSGDTRLQINGGQYGTLNLRSTSVNASVRAHNPNGGLYVGTTSNHFATIFTNDTERMRITSGGNILMGTTSDNGYRLRVSGGIYGNNIYLQQTAANGGGILTLANNDISAESGAIIGQVNFYNTDNDIFGVAAYMRAYTGSSFGVGGQLGFGTQNTWSSGTLNQRMFIDNAGNIGAPSGTNIYNASDVRLKRNIVSIESGLDKVMQLNPVKFNWIEKFVESEQGKDMLGFIAQEVLPHIPEAVESFGESDLYIDGVVIEKPLRINEKFIIPVLVKAIQEQQTQINELKALINA